MSTNIYRFLTNFRKNKILNRLINALDKKYPNYALGSNTPLPNQLLPTASKTNGDPIILYFTEKATHNLNVLRDLAQEKTVYRQKKEKIDKPIEFLCYGYIDSSNDIVINTIEIPYLEHLLKSNNNNILSDEIKEKFFNQSSSKIINEELIKRYYNYLQSENTFLDKKIGKIPVAFYGTTKPVVDSVDNTQYCPKFSEIAKAIVPGDLKFNHPFVSGLLIVNPKYIIQTTNGYKQIDGSLECIPVTYEINKNNTAKPTNLYNIMQCQQTNKNGKLEIVEISKSKQPCENLPLPFEHSKYL